MERFSAGRTPARTNRSLRVSMSSRRNGSGDVGGSVPRSAPCCVGPAPRAPSRAVALATFVLLEAVRPGWVPDRSLRRVAIAGVVRPGCISDRPSRRGSMSTMYLKFHMILGQRGAFAVPHSVENDGSDLAGSAAPADLWRGCPGERAAPWVERHRGAGRLRPEVGRRGCGHRAWLGAGDRSSLTACAITRLPRTALSLRRWPP